MMSIFGLYIHREKAGVSGGEAVRLSSENHLLKIRVQQLQDERAKLHAGKGIAQ